MKIKIFIISITFALLLSSAPTMASPHGAGYDGGTGKLAQVAGYFSGGGGEFTLYDDATTSLQLSNIGYADVAKGVLGTNSFQTFCIESYEYVVNPMNIHVSTAFVDGSTPGSHAYTGGPPGSTGDDLDSKTAYLYTQFALGILSDYDYVDATVLGRAESAKQLQQAIWFIEGESGSNIGQAGDWIQEAQDEINAKRWAGLGDVRVLQMYGGTDDYRQDQLYFVPIPATLLLGVIGLCVAGVKLRKYA